MQLSLRTTGSKLPHYQRPADAAQARLNHESEVALLVVAAISELRANTCGAAMSRTNDGSRSSVPASPQNPLLVRPDNPLVEKMHLIGFGFPNLVLNPEEGPTPIPTLEQ